MSAAKSAPQYKFAIEISSGGRNGERIDFDTDRITLGRSSDNTISFPEDAKVSRRHAVIEVMGDSIIISNVSERNILKVNDQVQRNTKLTDRDKILLGTTELTFHFVKFGVARSASEHSLIVPANQGGTATPAELPPMVPGQPGANPVGPHVQQPVGQPRPQNPNSASWEAPKPKKSKTNFYIIVAVVLGLFLWILLDDPPPPEEELELRTKDQIKADLNASESKMQDIVQSRKKAGRQSAQWKKAQAAFVKGRRDYQHRKFGRAIQSFQASLSIFPDHVLARQYLRLSRRKFDEVVQLTMIQGRKYREKRNFRMCTSQFALVMTMIRDNQNSIYKEAKQFHDECSLMLEGRY